MGHEHDSQSDVKLTPPAIASETITPWMRWERFRRPLTKPAIALAVLCAIGLSVRFVLASMPRETEGCGVSCGSNMRQLALSMVMYGAYEEDKLFPPLSLTPPYLLWSVDAVMPEYAPDPYILLCPDFKTTKSIARSIQRDKSSWEEKRLRLANESSYWYIAHVIRTESEMLDYLEEYRKACIEQDQEVLSDPASARWTAPDRFLPFSHIEGRGLGEQIQGDPMAPLYIERPGHHEGSAGHVLWGDASVTLVEYGKFPYTDKILDALNEFDEL